MQITSIISPLIRFFIFIWESFRRHRIKLSVQTDYRVKAGVYSPDEPWEHYLIIVISVYNDGPLPFTVSKVGLFSNVFTPLDSYDLPKSIKPGDEPYNIELLPDDTIDREGRLAVELANGKIAKLKRKDMKSLKDEMSHKKLEYTE